MSRNFSELKSGGTIPMLSPTLKSGGTRPPPVPHRSTPVAVGERVPGHCTQQWAVTALPVTARRNFSRQ